MVITRRTLRRKRLARALQQLLILFVMLLVFVSVALERILQNVHMKTAIVIVIIVVVFS